MHRFPFDTLKIDRAFVANIAKDKASKKLVKVIVNLAIDMELDIVAEGIEEQHEFEAFGIWLSLWAGLLYGPSLSYIKEYRVD